MQENQISHAFSTNETNQRGHDVLLQSFSEECRRREDVNRKCYPKVNTCSEKVLFKKNFLELMEE